MIKFENVFFAYDDGELVLKDFSEEFAEGETIAVMGQSGVGKTTLLRLLAGLEKPAEGRIIADSKLKIACSSAENDLLPGGTVLENVAVVSNKDEAKKQLEALGLDENCNDEISSLSTGMAKRVSIARAMAYKADVLIMDEPFAPLDKETKTLVAEHIKSCFKGKLIVFSTHDESDVEIFNARKVIL